MVIKKCIVCGKEFDTKRGAKTCNKECSKEHTRQRKHQYYQDNKEHIRRKRKQYYQDNKEHIRQYGKQYYQDNKEYYQQYGRQHRQDNKEYYQQYGRQHRQNNKEYYQQYHKQYYQDNKGHKKQYQRENKEHILEYQYQYNKRKVNKLIKQYDGDLKEILKNIPSRWQLREAQMQIWFNESYYDGVITKIKSTPCCEITGEKDNLVVHHLYSFNTHPELGADPANMVRVKEEIHKEFHKQYGYGNNTPQQWEEFVNST